MASQEQHAQAQSFLSSAIDWTVHNKLKAVLYTWGTGVTASLAYNWTRPIPTSLKIIHSRVYAQALTLAALGAVAGVEMYAASQEGHKKEDKHGY